MNFYTFHVGYYDEIEEENKEANILICARSYISAVDELVHEYGEDQLEWFHATCIGYETRLPISDELYESLNKLGEDL